MKLRLLQLLLIMMFFGSCQFGEKPKEKSRTETYILSANKKGKSEMKFEKVRFDFGKIQLGDSVRHSFKFKNTGKEPVIISHVTTSCGCTVSSFPKKPIPVNGIDSVEAVYSSALKGKGMQNKVLHVYSNASEPVILLSLYGRVD